MTTAFVQTRQPRGLVLAWAMLVGLTRRSPTFVLGTAIVLVFAALAALAPWLTDYRPTQTFPDHVLSGPSAQFWFGTDGNGMDVFSRVIHGSQYAFGIAIPALLLMMVIGVPAGLIAGYRGGAIDDLLLRTFDVLRAFPTIVLALAVVAATGQSIVIVVLVIGFLEAPIFARIVRSEVLALRSSELVEAAVAVGNSTWRVMLVHVLPNSIRGATAQMAIRMAWAIRVSTTLAFIGVGIQAPAPEWGVMIRQGAEYINSGEWWIATFPGVALVGLVLGLNLFGDGAQDLLDPKHSDSR
ncbi:MAG: ABC transporter permease [Alphaproteobacteria bacterium]|nr:ABC transporter permease [Alphaproteobacteria bacterium]